MEGRDEWLAALADEVENPLAPVAGVEAELVLERYHVGGPPTDLPPGAGVGVGVSVVDDDLDPPVLERDARPLEDGGSGG